MSEGALRLAVWTDDVAEEVERSMKFGLVSSLSYVFGP